MTVETLKKAQTLQDRIKRAEDVLEMLNAVKNSEIQVKETAEEDFVTKLALCDESECTRGYYYLTKDQIEIIKKPLRTTKINSMQSLLCCKGVI